MRPHTFVERLVEGMSLEAIRTFTVANDLLAARPELDKKDHPADVRKLIEYQMRGVRIAGFLRDSQVTHPVTPAEVWPHGRPEHWSAPRPQLPESHRAAWAQHAELHS